jgi:exonuclease III
VITWNVARRVTRLAEQAAALAERAPDVVALQEVTTRTLPLWREALRAHGLAHVLASEPTRARGTRVLLAARAPATPVEPLPVPWGETALGAEVGGVTVHTVHVPNAANGWVKIRTLEAVRAGLAAGAGPRVLSGDLNTPRRELPDGTVLSFARDTRGRLRPERGDEWDAGELGVVPGLRDLGFADAFRAVHGYERKEPSWVYFRRPEGAGHGQGVARRATQAHRSSGWRLDHLFASAELETTASRYHHEWRDAGLSDHSALEADLRLRPPRPARRRAPAPPRA